MKEEAWVGIIAISGFIGVFGLIYWLIVRASRQSYESLCYLAQRLQFEIAEPNRLLGIYDSPDLKGEIRGKQVRFYNYTTGGNKSKTTWAAIAVAPREHGGLTFTLSREGLGTRMLEFFGAKQIEIGEAGFDGDWFIQTNAPDFFAPALLPEIQRKIQLYQGQWKLEDGEVIYAEKGSLIDRERCDRFVEIVDVACDLADLAEVYAQQSRDGRD